MTLKEHIRAQAVLKTLALREGTTVAAVRASMQEALDEAWAASGNGSTEAWHRYFPDGKKPSVEELMVRLAKELNPSS